MLWVVLGLNLRYLNEGHKLELRRHAVKKSCIHVSLLAIMVMGLQIPSLWADSLELKDGHLINGKYLGGTEATINFLINGKVERYAVANVLMLSFGDDSTATPATIKRGAETSNAPAVNSSSRAITVPAGTHLVVRTIDSIDSKTNKIGDRFHASLDETLLIDDRIVARKGADVYGRLIEAKQAGRIEGQSELRLELTGIQIGQQVVPIVTGEYQVAGKSRGRNTAEKVGGGAALGAVIGAIAGGGKGAAIGAGVGAGAGGAVQVLTHGQQVHVPSETLLEFTLQQPVTVNVSATSTN